ncbi:type-F conjugative transfer system pilin assembly protein TrbC [Pantoea sp. OXWO6B1]|jgi:conjugal transfer pilus assembly protein TrbC|uniref:type-F conjugative transfer system pilin assembly protein TrbC n=1 Tax=Pantoea sp. OXWO6B1 TaxID=1835724 RepID=UPI0007C64499|nr:type-F conjugative transfer system pilin assembly protein TrbC [Pantoea sp. OXWO6B1]OAD97952.1 type-F conjugative transfer system pilin assembly protein TrbC [Pantoea sp. OXWO6B1]
MKTFLMTVLVLGTALSFARAAEQPAAGQNDVAWMKQQQRDLELFKKQLQGTNIALPDAQQGRVTTFQNEIAAAQAEQNSASRETPRAVYFVSLGIPQEGLLPMLEDARRFGIPATIRGLVDNDFRKTASMMFDLSKKDKQAGVQIDPTLFRQYGIKAVPALVVTCGAEFDVIYGSLELKQALKEVQQRGDCAGTAAQLLEAGERPR